MAWLELHQTMPRHRKTLALAGILKISRREAVGLMCDLWTWAVDNADRDGVLSGLDAFAIASALDFPKSKSKALLSALVQCGYVEEYGVLYRIHDWYSYCGKLNDRRAADRKRKSESAKIQLEVPCNSVGIPMEITRSSVCNSTLPYPTVSKHEEKDVIAQTPGCFTSGESEQLAFEEDLPARTNHVENGGESFISPSPNRREEMFNAFWAAYPRKKAKGAAIKAWGKLKVDERLLAQMVKKIEEQKGCRQWAKDDGEFIPYPATWLNSMQWEDEIPGEASSKSGPEARESY